MKTIYLLRHAKAGSSDSGTEDFYRPLNERGQRNAIQIGRYLSDNNIRPDLILCSEATRTQETLSYLRPFLPESQVIHVEKELYLASTEILLKHLTRLDDTANSVMVIAHNPGLQELAITLGGHENFGTSKLLNQVMQKFPTGALTTAENTSEQWTNLNSGDSTLIDFICPSDLPPLMD